MRRLKILCSCLSVLEHDNDSDTLEVVNAKIALQSQCESHLT